MSTSEQKMNCDELTKRQSQQIRHSKTNPGICLRVPLARSSGMKSGRWMRR